MNRLTMLILALVLTVNATAASKDSGKTTLKDLQPVGVIDEKHKYQQYDLLFVTMSGKDYTCRTGEKTRLKVTDFVVGSNLEYVVSGNKAKLKSSSGKQVTPSAAIMISAPRRSA